MEFVDKSVVEGAVKYRDGKKWKSRWCIASKHSPVADCLNLQLYRDSKDKLKQGQTKANLSLENLLAIESGFTLDKESHTLAILCQDITVILAFESREILIHWQVKIRTNLGEDQQYQVQVAHAPAKSKISPGAARLHVQDWLFCLVAGLPPRLLNYWHFPDLRKYGVVDGKFCFEGGSRCGKGEGLHVLTSNQPEELSTTFDLASQGKLQTKKKNLPTKVQGKLITSGLDGTLRKSGAGQPVDHKTGDLCSAESTRPLLNSSESSICDACSEVVRYGGVDCWMSTESCHMGSMDTLSVAVSESAIDGSGPLKVWVPEAGAYLVDRVALLERCTEQTMLSPKWLEENGESGDSGDKNCGKMSADVLSLSSQGSNSSSSEYSVPRRACGADAYYDKPRNVLGTLAASEAPSLPPRSPMKAKMDSKTAVGKVRTGGPCYHPLEMKTDAPQNLPGLQVSRCACLGSPMWDNPAYVRTPGSNSGSPLCSPKKGHSHLPHVPVCNSPTKIRPTGVHLNLMSPSRKSALGTPSSVASTPGICSCGQTDPKLNPYGDYAIPRTALAHMYLKEQQLAATATASSSTATTPSCDKLTNSTRTSIVSSDSSDYDVPRRVKECLVAMDAAEKQDGSLSSVHPQQMFLNGLGLTFQACSCGLRGGLSSRPTTSVCPCQRVINWAEHLVPCRRQVTLDETNVPCPHQKAVMETKVAVGGKQGVKSMVHHHLCSCPRGQETDWVSRPPVDPRTKPMTAPTAGVLSVPCTTQPTSDVPASLKWTALKGTPQLPNYSNVEIVQNCYEKAEGSARDLKANYANLEFVESLPLYENTGAVLSRTSGVTASDETTQGDVKATDTKEEKKALPQGDSEHTSAYGVSSRCTSCGHNFVRMVSEPSISVSRPPSVAEIRKTSHDDSNYLLMQPVSGRCTPIGTPLYQPTTLPRDRKSFRGSDNDLTEESSPIKTSEYIRMSDIAEDLKNLPLRPFMPLQMGSQWKDYEPPKSFRARSSSNASDTSSLRSSFMNRSMSLEPRAVRSSSVVELKKEVYLRKRSSSADGRQGSLSAVTTTELEVSMRTYVTYSPRRPSLLTRLTSAGVQAKSHGSEEFHKSSSVSSQTSSPRNHSTESLEKNGALDVDVVLRNFEVNGKHNSEISPTNITRSSSVPCNSGNRDSASSSDSGVSTGSPKQASGFPGTSDNAYMEMSAVKAAGGGGPCDSNNGLMLRLKCREATCKSAPIDSDVPVWIKRDDLKADCSLSPSQELLVHSCFVDSKSNSSTSDMSDYIETLSLSSHGSNDLPRMEDGPRIPCCITSTLRPRSGREYQMLDRTLLEECLLHQPLDCNTSQGPTCNVEMPRGDTLTVRSEKTDSPSPGYGSSSSPAEGQREVVSPDQRNVKQ